jgi:hypothetical protein
MKSDLIATELLVVLPGITAHELQCRSGERFLRQHSQFDVWYQRFSYRWGPTQCADHLAQVLLPKCASYERVHFLNYIRGGMAFLTFIAQHPLPQLGNVVFDRGSAAEQVPGRALETFGGIGRRVLGRGVEEVANWREEDWQWEPPDGCRTGVLMEQGISRFARLFAIKPRHLVLPPSFRFHESRAVAESHDEVYTSPVFLSLALSFLERGTFSAK